MLSPFIRTHWIDQSPEGKLIATVAPKNYQITHYSYFRSYTLTSWRVSEPPEKWYGESLWFNHEPLATTGGALDIYQEEFVDKPFYETPIIQREQTSVFKLINPIIGLYNLPKPVALYLRNPANQVYLVLE